MLDSKGNVINYEDRFQYAKICLTAADGEREITGELGKVTGDKGSRGKREGENNLKRHY